MADLDPDGFKPATATTITQVDRDGARRYTITDPEGNRWIIPAGRMYLSESRREGSTWTDGLSTMKGDDVVVGHEFRICVDEPGEPSDEMGGSHLVWYEAWVAGHGPTDG